MTLGYQKNKDRRVFSVHNKEVMPDNIRLQIFQRAFTTKGKGRGVGCYSVKFLTETYLNGKVSFVSEAGKGTIFTVEI